MDDQTLTEIVAEIEPLLRGRAPGKIFQLGPLSLVIDFRLRDHGDLFISVEPAQPRMYLVKRRVRDLEKQSVVLTQFAQGLRKELSDTTVQSLKKDPDDRIVRFHFSGKDELGKTKESTMIAQLTGRSANLFLSDPNGVITHHARPGKGSGQKTGEVYQAPATTGSPRAASDAQRPGTNADDRSASEAADAYFSSLLVGQAFDNRAAVARAELRKKITQRKRLLKQLEQDLASHAGAEQQKRLGDILLANLTTAKRDGKRVVLIDYFTDDASPIEIEIDEQMTLQEEASRRFAFYSRSKRAVQQITPRIESIRPQLEALNSQYEALEKIIAARDEAALEKSLALSAPRSLSAPSRSAGGALSVPPALAGGSRRKPEKKIPGVRRYISSDGYEILVGRAARDNDYLTFKVAKPNDLWLHAADYGGSHVVVRNATRKEVPHRTIIEAAQLAAQFSQARKDPKVDVHYTERKFVSKPKGSAPGLVRLLRSRNILVEPKEAIERI
jgi:predicted ribosome quality control (RQC) complex YloA/Tae2 family protein